MISNVLFWLDKTVRRFESRLSSDVQFYIEILSKEISMKGDEVYVTIFVEFIIGIIGRIVSGLFTTYIVRLFDKIMHKNNRPE